MDIDFITTELLFTQSGVYKSISDIKNFVKQFDFVRYDDILTDEEIRDVDYLDEIKIDIPLTTEMNKNLDIAMNIKNDCESFSYSWRRIYDNKRYWQLCLGGRFLFKEEEEHRAIVEGTKTLDNCKYPNEFTDMYQGITNILREKSIKKICDVPPRETFYF